MIIVIVIAETGRAGRELQLKKQWYLEILKFSESDSDQSGSFSAASSCTRRLETAKRYKIQIGNRSLHLKVYFNTIITLRSVLEGLANRVVSAGIFELLT